MQRIRTSFFLSAALALVFTGGLAAADEQSGGTVDDMADVVNVDRASVHPVEGTDGAAELLVSGTLPSSCHQPVWEVINGPDAVQVWLWSWPGDDPDCEATLAPFELSIPLDGVDASVPIMLGSEPVAWSSGVASDAVVALTGAGWSFGMCLGYCEADIEIGGVEAVMTGKDRDLSEPLFVNRGQLTPAGESMIQDALGTLGGSVLEPVYGCPDCADGGAAYIRLQRDSGETVYDMEFGAPPAELSALYDITTAIGNALETCSSDELITVAEDCVVAEQT